MRYIVLFLSSLFMVESVFTNAVAAVSLPSLSSAMNQRLLVMKDVAGYKAEHHLPVEDLVREQKVMSLAREEATAAGLEPQSVVPFIQAQMDVAKAIQYRYLADWLSRPEKDWRARDLDEVRKIISDQDNVILHSISQRLLVGGLSEADKSAMVSELTAPQLSNADKHRLVDTMAAIKRRT
ncbi:chorismate mutase [Ewingella americana]|uniref:Chorismate mutase n=1 Tax=Ewingella americana TaxID=41202 RepID=A0A502GUJ1_9GAMM|nr:chorismate mutase [Ewingella americana]TPG64910.1 chorismate mutase [Ewingella americana]